MEPFSALLTLWKGNPPVIALFPSQEPVTRSFDVLFYVRLNGWANNRDAGDLLRHDAHYDGTAKQYIFAADRLYRYQHHKF